MKILGAEVAECTEPVMEYVEVKLEAVTSIMYVGRDEWQPITAKIKQTDENSKLIGLQLKKQIEYFKEKTKEPYKFDMETDKWLLKGCLFQDVIYGDDSDSYMEIIIRYNNATKK